MNQAAQKELSRKEYWDERYINESNLNQPDEANYEWFKTFEQLRPFLQNHLPSPSSEPRILHCGCGTSSLTADLYAFGYTNQISIDFSEIAIEDMKQKYAALDQDWKVMDVRQMDIENAMIDIAIDKGTLDAMLHGSLWDPEDDVKENVGAYVNEVGRILKPGGTWIYCSYRQPHFLKPLLARPNVWSLQVHTLQDVPGSFEYFGFVMTKVIEEAHDMLAGTVSR